MPPPGRGRAHEAHAAPAGAAGHHLRDGQQARFRPRLLQAFGQRGAWRKLPWCRGTGLRLAVRQCASAAAPRRRRHRGAAILLQQAASAEPSAPSATATGISLTDTARSGLTASAVTCTAKGGAARRSHGGIGAAGQALGAGLVKQRRRRTRRASSAPWAAVPRRTVQRAGSCGHGQAAFFFPVRRRPRRPRLWGHGEAAGGCRGNSAPRARQVADAADVGGALGHADDRAARVQQVEVWAAFSTCS